MRACDANLIINLALPKYQAGIHVGYAKYIWRELVFLLAYRRGVTL